MGPIEIITLIFTILSIGLIIKKKIWSIPIWGLTLILIFLIYNCHSGYRRPVVVPDAMIIEDFSRRYDQYCYLTAHNAYANHEDGWYYAQQTYSIPRQLQYGVRALMLDIWQYAPKEQTKDIYLCHLECDGKTNRACSGFRKTPTRLQEALEQIKTFLVTNPNEIITLIFESNVGEGAKELITKAFHDSQITSLLFYADRFNQVNSSNWDVRTQGWPTLQWMIDHNKRLVVLSDHKSGANDGIPFLWEFAVESVYGNESVNQIIKARKESSALDDITKALFVLNYFPAQNIGGILPQYRYNKINDYKSNKDYNGLENYIQSYTDKAIRPPNFLAVDFFEIGNNGGIYKALTEINAKWEEILTHQ